MSFSFSTSRADCKDRLERWNHNHRHIGVEKRFTAKQLRSMGVTMQRVVLLPIAKKATSVRKATDC